MSIVPWARGKLLVWDVTCSVTFAPSNLSTAVTTAGAVADRAEVLECEKYSHLDSTYEFVPVAVESCVLLGSQTREFLRDPGRRLKAATFEAMAHQYLIQRQCSICLGSMGVSQGGWKIFELFSLYCCCCLLLLLLVLLFSLLLLLLLLLLLQSRLSHTCTIFFCSLLLIYLR